MRKILLVVSFFVIASVVLVSGCTSTPAMKSYSGNGVSFNYPETWNVEAQNEVKGGAVNYADAEFVVAVGNGNKDNKGNEEFIVYKQKNNTNSSRWLSKLFNGTNPSEWASSYKTSIEKVMPGTVSLKTRTVDGVNANEVEITGDKVLWNHVYFTKNDVGYSLDYISASKNQAVGDSIFNSFKVL